MLPVINLQVTSEFSYEPHLSLRLIILPLSGRIRFVSRPVFAEPVAAFFAGPSYLSQSVSICGDVGERLKNVRLFLDTREKVRKT